MSSYVVWIEHEKHFPKTSRYSVGARINDLFFDVIDSTSTAVFLPRQNKLPYVRRAVVKLDTLKIFTQIAWQLGALDNKKYATLSEHLVEIGKMLGGWSGQLSKQNSPAKTEEK
jgi:hypothetical protein